MTMVYPRESFAVHPPLDYAGYRSTAKRSPRRPLVIVPHTLSELTGPVYGHDVVRPGDEDLTRQHSGEPLGERIIVHGRVLDEDGRPVPNTLVEIWQANASGRYIHVVDQHPAPLDPNFTGAGRAATDRDGWYKFVTVKPGAYPWGNHHNAWRPNHIHFSGSCASAFPYALASVRVRAARCRSGSRAPSRGWCCPDRSSRSCAGAPSRRSPN